MPIQNNLDRLNEVVETKCMVKDEMKEDGDTFCPHCIAVSTLNDINESLCHARLNIDRIVFNKCVIEGDENKS